MLLGSAAAAIACWKWLPGTEIDRTLFSAVSRSFANPPFFISGDGRLGSPWTLRTFASANQSNARQAPVIVSLGDDVEGFFQSSPPSPVDVAVILTNFQRLRAKKAAIAGVLAWEKPNVLDLAALDKAIMGFDSLVMTAPLSRGALPETMPLAFRNASVPLNAVQGDSSALPVVNRIPLPGVILGKENTVAGFQTLDSEPESESVPLMARWEDRVVFAFPLLTVMQRLNLPVDGMEIKPGEYLKLGPNGPIVPINRFGHMTLPLKNISPYAVIPAELLIDGGNDLFPKTAPEPVILRDDRSSAEPATRAFSRHLPAVVAALASDAGLSSPHAFPRPRMEFELAVLSLVTFVLTAFCGKPAFIRNIAFLSLAAAMVSAQIIAAASALVWLPGLPSLAAVLAAFATSGLIKVDYNAPKPPRVVRERRVKKAPVPKPTPSPAREPATPVAAPAQKTKDKKPRARAKKRRR